MRQAHWPNPDCRLDEVTAACSRAFRPQQSQQDLVSVRARLEIEQRVEGEDLEVEVWRMLYGPSVPSQGVTVTVPSWESATFSICCAVMRATTIGAEHTCP